MSAKKILFWSLRILLLIILYMPIWILGSMAVAGYIPDTPTEPGLVDSTTGIFLLSIINTLLIVSLIYTSRWSGWRLAFLLALSYYGSFTFITQLETWYFLAGISSGLLVGLFIMGIPVAFLFIPLAVLVCRRTKPNPNTEPKWMEMPMEQWALKLAVIAVVYVIIYWTAGYFIAWQNPELRAFYGSPGEIVPFWKHTLNSFRDTPDLFLLQLLRGVLFAVIAIPVIRGSTVNPWWTALLVGLLLAVPHLSHILSNPLMPLASVRISHMVETATSTFVFGLIIVWLLHRRHEGMR